MSFSQIYANSINGSECARSIDETMPNYSLGYLENIVELTQVSNLKNTCHSLVQNIMTSYNLSAENFSYNKDFNKLTSGSLDEEDLTQKSLSITKGSNILLGEIVQLSMYDIVEHVDGYYAYRTIVKYVVDEKCNINSIYSPTTFVYKVKKKKHIDRFRVVELTDAIVGLGRVNLELNEENCKKILNKEEYLLNKKQHRDVYKSRFTNEQRKYFNDKIIPKIGAICNNKYNLR